MPGPAQLKLSPADRGRTRPARILARLDGLPFGAPDTSCGTENELQAVVQGPRDQVDLPRAIEQSNYFRNLLKRHQRGETPTRVVSDLEAWLEHNPDEVWESSWVRLPADALGPWARRTLEQDLKADKGEPSSRYRTDLDRFLFREQGRTWLRVPVSYLLKLSLAQAAHRDAPGPGLLEEEAARLMDHFLSDNTSPETCSLYLAGGEDQGGLGRATARETALRYLLTRLLADYAGKCFQLDETGQRVSVFFSPHPPARLQRLSEAVSDSFYRELFMNPCLAGWDQGEDKHAYMHLCHQVLSRAQLNALGLLKEAGIITRNLVVLPPPGNISLANNGTHISLGSGLLSQAAEDGGALGPAREKYLGDLAIKFIEHFLPLFVGTVSAAPLRLGFGDFHPERVLGFLPYELDFTHLRMLWRRWKKKADLKARLLGLRLTPLGPPWLDGALSRVLRMRGDLVPDYRLLNYLAAVMSTHHSPALDGRLGNHQRLKQDLALMGVFDPHMPLYMLYRQRERALHGYSGFEGRHYSLFESLDRDLADATDLQWLITALAYKLMAAGRLDHDMIPDNPEVESERRQIFFGAAIGLPTFFVKADTPNRLLRRLVAATPGVRPSRRYHGYLRVRHFQFRQALVEFIRGEGADLVERQGAGEVMARQQQWAVKHPAGTATERLLDGILGAGRTSQCLEVPAEEFNLQAERYYRGELSRRHLGEALDIFGRMLARDLPRLTPAGGRVRIELHLLLGVEPASQMLRRLRPKLESGELDQHRLRNLIHLLILTIHQAAARQPHQTAGGAQPSEKVIYAGSEPSVH